MVARCGLYNSLAQTLLKLHSPGVPDIYQGNELFDFSLVDPDNRRAVDYDKRRAMLDEIRGSLGPDGPDAGEARAMLDSIDDGRLKLYVIWRSLWLRARRPELFECSRYVPLSVVGARASHVCAFARMHETGAVVIVVPRLLLDLTAQATRLPLGGEIWGDTRVTLPWPSAKYADVLTGTVRDSPGATKSSQLSVGELLDTLPVALLENMPASTVARRSARTIGTRRASIHR